MTKKITPCAVFPRCDRGTLVKYKGSFFVSNGYSCVPVPYSREKKAAARPWWQRLSRWRR